ncbi:hydantoinase/oxoprolinase family protein [Veillonella tobetsuensis]|uniref:Hydantoinase/oxoprolinase n=1 Tax=Veillonella tobetsuensis TaxID=1110546 RepID=A0A2S7ZS85_9FIRM|nr:hydantoinase/oxoprolinase family protein [Veillonella tobetsuensis]PQL26126.1 hydantoinase/oxoprolinase [Veillonella tobetsuensis]
MLLGIDVGGTFTDAVIIDGANVVSWAKRRTTKDNLMNGITEALGAVLVDIDSAQIEQVTLSTTVVTNTIVEHKEQPVDLYVIAGPGRNVDDIFPVRPVYLKGYTDHRGIVVESTKCEAINHIAHTVQSRSGTNLAAVSAKFGVRNPKEELDVTNALSAMYDTISTGSSLSGNLNFPRRTISAYFNSAVTDVFNRFRQAVRDALVAHNITAPVYILKADGGSLPIDTIASVPVETVFTGPAATVLGLEALRSATLGHTVALDIGGTTTDISLWKQGKPLMTKEGVSIRNYPSAVRSFAVTSVGIGGESVVRYNNGNLTVGPERVGPSVALGGIEPTLGDALIVLGKAQYGNGQKAYDGIAQIDSTIDATTMAQRIVNVAVQVIQEGIDTVVANENKRPIYVVADIVHPDPFVPAQLVIVGGTAASLGPIIGDQLGLPIRIPSDAAVANAIGAGVANHTMAITIHVDTKRRTMVVPELGIQDTSSHLRSAQAVEEVAYGLLREAAKEQGLVTSDVLPDIETISVEDFPVVDGWQSMERIITVKVQLQAGVSSYVES